MLQGKTAVVTGGAQGIGRAICELYAAQGAKVAVVDMQDGEAAAAGIREGGGEAIYVQCDVTARASVDAAAATIREKLGQIDILVNNAGNTSPAMIEKMTDDNWDKVIAVHMTGGFYWLQAAIPDMIENKWGRVIFSSSFTAQLGSIGQLSYSAAKSGILGMVRSASRELGKHNILVNAVSPAAPTEMNRKVREDPKFAERHAAIVAASTLRREAPADEVAKVYLFLASDLSSFVTGQVISADGGHMMVR